MSLFEVLYNDRSQNEKEALKPSEVNKIVTRKERLKSWIKTCLKGAIQANAQSAGRLEEELISLRAKLINGDEGVIRAIMEKRFLIEETKKQTPFLEDEYEVIFGEKP